MEIAFGPYEPDVASVGTNKTSFVKNVFPRSDGYGPIPNIEAFTHAMNGTPRGFSGAVQSDGTTAVFGGNDFALYRLDATAKTWGDVSASGGYRIQPGELWDFAQFGNNVIATSADNNPQVYTLGSSTAFADLGGSPPQARRVSVVGDFVVLSGITGVPNRIHFSGINNITTWTPGTNQCDTQDFPDGGGVQAVAGGEYGLVFQDRAIRRMIYTGPPEIFQFERISEDRGCLMRYSVCKAGGQIFFLSNDGFYKIDRSGAMTPIGNARVDRTALGDIDFSSQANMVGATDPLSKRVFWFYKSINSASSGLDKCLVYDWSLDRWSPAELGALFASSVIPLTITLEGLDALYSSIDTMPVSFDSFKGDLSSALAVMNPDGTLGFMSGKPMEATLETPEGSLPGGQLTMVRGAAPVGDSSFAYVSIKSRDRLIDDYRLGPESMIGVRGYAPQRTQARFNIARLRIPENTPWTFVRSVDVDAVARGRR
jgi:hypothetical protein